jgi:hypothetical protein
MIVIHPKKLRLIEHILIALFFTTWVAAFSTQFTNPFNYLTVVISVFPIYLFVNNLRQKRFYYHDQSKVFTKFDYNSITNNEINFSRITNYKIEKDESKLQILNYADLKNYIFKIDYKKKKLKYKPYLLVNIFCEIDLKEILHFDILKINEVPRLTINVKEGYYYPVLNIPLNNIFESDFENNKNNNNSIKLLLFLNSALKN